MHFRV